MDKTYIKLIEQTKKYINSLDENDYFKISLEDAEKLGILPKLTENLCRGLSLDLIYFNKNDALYFNHKIDKEGKIRFSPEVLRYFFENLHDPIKFSWDSQDENLTFKIYLTSFFLWISKGIDMIATSNGKDYASFKNEIFAKMLQFSSNNDIMIFFINEIISFLKTNLNDNSNLKLFQLDIQTIFNTYNKIHENELLKVDDSKSISYKIALLNEIGFFQLDSIKNLTKENQIEIVQKLLGGTTRYIKGNINILGDASNEDGLKYTSHKHIEGVKKYLRKLQN